MAVLLPLATDHCPLLWVKYLLLTESTFLSKKKGGKDLGSVDSKTVVLTNECTSPRACMSLTYRMSTEKWFDQLLVSQYEIKWSHSKVPLLPADSYTSR